MEPALYCRTKEGYKRWVTGLDALTETRKAISDEALAAGPARSLERREVPPMFLRLKAASHSMEWLAAFKKAYGASLEAAICLLGKLRPQMSAADRQKFVYAFFSLGNVKKYAQIGLRSFLE